MGFLLGVAADLATQGANALIQGAQNRKQRKWLEKRYGVERQDALADWNMQNEYDSPAAQMARLKAAGLNPNLVYGNGADAQMGAPVRSSDTGSWNPRAPQMDFGSAVQSGLGAYYDTQIKQATIDNMAVQKTVAEMDAMLKATQAYSTLTNVDKTKQDIDITSQMKEYTIAAAKASVSKTLADTKSTLDENDRRAAMQASNLQQALENILTSRLNRTKTDVEKQHIQQQIANLKKDEELKQLDINLKKQGIQPGDPMYMRVLSQYLKDVDLKKLGDKFYKGFTSPVDTNRVKTGGSQWRANNP